MTQGTRELQTRHTALSLQGPRTRLAAVTPAVLALFLSVSDAELPAVDPAGSEQTRETNKEGNPVRILNQWYGSQGGRSTPIRRIIRDPERFEAVWRARSRGDPPDIDFSRHTVLLVEMGMRNTGGHAVRIQSVEERDGKLFASVLSTSPGPDAIVIQALTHPWCMAVIDANGKDVEFVDADPPDTERHRRPAHRLR